MITEFEVYEGLLSECEGVVTNDDDCRSEGLFSDCIDAGREGVVTNTGLC